MSQQVLGGAKKSGSRQKRRRGRSGQGIVEINRKTKLCHHWRTGACPYGAATCAFAHGLGELRHPTLDDEAIAGSVTDDSSSCASLDESPAAVEERHYERRLPTFVLLGHGNPPTPRTEAKAIGASSMSNGDGGTPASSSAFWTQNGGSKSRDPISPAYDGKGGASGCGKSSTVFEAFAPAFSVELSPRALDISAAMSSSSREAYAPAFSAQSPSSVSTPRESLTPVLSTASTPQTEGNNTVMPSLALMRQLDSGASTTMHKWTPTTPWMKDSQRGGRDSDGNRFVSPPEFNHEPFFGAYESSIGLESHKSSVDLSRRPHLDRSGSASTANGSFFRAHPDAAPSPENGHPPPPSLKNDVAMGEVNNGLLDPTASDDHHSKFRPYSLW